MAQEWTTSGWKAEWVVLSTTFAAQYPAFVKFAGSQGCPVYEGSESDMKKICDTEAPQGIAIAVRYPADSEAKDFEGPLVYFDDIQDPGNLGTMVRTADWFGVRYVLCSPGCAEIRNPKVVRATMGSVFRTVVVENADLKILEKTRKLGYTWLAASPTGAGLSGQMAGKKFGIMIGNESRGLSSKMMNWADRRVSIPQFGKAESLNAAVACGILLHQYCGNSHVDT